MKGVGLDARLHMQGCDSSASEGLRTSAVWTAVPRKAVAGSRWHVRVTLYIYRYDLPRGWGVARVWSGDGARCTRFSGVARVMAAMRGAPAASSGG